MVDNLHGTLIPDPYRWLEDPDSDETKHFVAAQNELTQSVLARCESREEFKQLFTKLYDYERFSVPSRKGDRYYFSRNTGLQAQSVLFSQAHLDEEPTLLLDPNTLSDDGTVALMGRSFSEDGKLMAYSLSSGGSDWRTIHLLEIDQSTGIHTKHSDILENVKFSGMTWTHDNLGFFYNRYEAPKTSDAGTETDSTVNQRVAYHRVGRPQEEDTDILSIEDQPEWMMGTEISHDGKYLIITVSSGCEPANRVWIVDLDTIPKDKTSGCFDFREFDIGKKSSSKALPMKKLVDDFEAQWEYLGNNGSLWTFQTNYNSPRYRVVRCDISTECSNNMSGWREIIPENGGRDVLQWCSLLKGDALVVCWLSNVQSRLEIRDFETGSLRREILLPDVGSVAGFSGDHRLSEFFFSFTGFTEPGAIYRCDAESTDPTPALYKRITTQGFSPDDFCTEQLWTKSKDGTEIPMFVVHRKGLNMNGRNPTLLYGYGGFNISLEPGFSVSRVCWLLAYDGVCVVANVRGGGEFGRDWRDAGSLGNKQNVFDDFQACAEYLHGAGYCSPSTLAIQGGSNGGLLVAACANQRPDLYAVVLAQVGVMDMLRFKYMTIGHAWVSDYGNVEMEEDFNWLVKYSPVHNVARPSDNGQYPAFFITTGDHDDRVVPLHSHKLTAVLQYVLAKQGVVASQRNPLLTRIETKAGHGAGKPTQKIIEETSDMYAFAAQIMGARFNVL